jgi:hypothetical protein
MSAPEQAAFRFGCACLLGAALGVLYGFLRPLRIRRTFFADFLFVTGLVYAWLYLSFAVCRGDLRLGYTAGLFLGCFLWELTLGKLLRPVFFGFWRIVGKVLGAITLPVRKIFKKIHEIIKFLFASLEKWGTIKWNNRRSMRRKSGGSHGTTQRVSVICQSGIPQEFLADKNRRSHRNCAVHRRASDGSQRH